jgi:hypothetical protein
LSSAWHRRTRRCGARDRAPAAPRQGWPLPPARAAPGDRIEPGEQLFHGKGLGEVIVAARFQPLDAVGQRAQRAQHQHRRARFTLRAHRAQHVESADVWQHAIEHDRIIPRLGQALQRGPAGGRMIGRTPGGAQPVEHVRGNHRIVFHHQAMHGQSF